MESWDLKTIEVEPHAPRILSSGDDARAVVLRLPAGEEMQEHEVHERARLIVIDGEVEVTTADGASIAAGAGYLLEFAPGERHSVAARTEARLLLVLSPWPGDGHPGVMSLEEKSRVREMARAAEAGDSAA